MRLFKRTPRKPQLPLTITVNTLDRHGEHALDPSGDLCVHGSVNLFVGDILKVADGAVPGDDTPLVELRFDSRNELTLILNQLDYRLIRRVLATHPELADQPSNDGAV